MSVKDSDLGIKFLEEPKVIKGFNPKTLEAWMMFEKAHKEILNPTNGKLGKYKLDGMFVYVNWKQHISFLSVPAMVQIFEDHSLGHKEFNVLLLDDYLIFQNNEPPDLLYHRELSLFEFCLEREFLHLK